LACYIPRWYTRPKTVTHPGTNRARRALTSFTRRTPLTTTPRHQPIVAVDAAVGLESYGCFRPTQYDCAGLEVRGDKPSYSVHCLRVVSVVIRCRVSTVCTYSCSISSLAVVSTLSAAVSHAKQPRSTGLLFYRRDAMIAGASYGPVSVSVSVTSRCSIKRDGRLICFLAWRLFSTSPTLCFKEIRVSTKVRILPRKTFS